MTAVYGWALIVSGSGLLGWIIGRHERPRDMSAVARGLADELALTNAERSAVMVLHDDDGHGGCLCCAEDWPCTTREIFYHDETAPEQEVSAA